MLLLATANWYKLGPTLCVIHSIAHAPPLKFSLAASVITKAVVAPHCLSGLDCSFFGINNMWPKTFIHDTLMEASMVDNVLCIVTQSNTSIINSDVFYKCVVCNLWLFYEMIGRSNEVGGRAHMEKEGLKRSLSLLQEKGVKLDSIVTDRHSQIQKFLREKGVQHFFDVWHVSKGTFSPFMFSLQKCNVHMKRWTHAQATVTCNCCENCLRKAQLQRQLGTI